MSSPCIQLMKLLRKEWPCCASICSLSKCHVFQVFISLRDMANSYYLVMRAKLHVYALIQNVVKGTILVGHNKNGFILGQCAQ